MESTNENQVYVNDDGKQVNMKLGKTILFTFLKSVGILVGLLFWFLAVVTALSPRLAINFYDTFGVDEASMRCYEQIYAKSNKNVDLYNLIERAVRAREYKTASKYIAELKQKDDYNQFVEKVNSASIKSSELKYVAYVGDLDSYLSSQLVSSLYRSKNKDEALNSAIADLSNPNKYSFALATYIDEVLKDKALTKEEKSQKIALLDVNSAQIETRLNAVNPDGATGKIEQILLVYASLKIEGARLNIATALGDETLAESCQTRIADLRTKYEQLING